MANHSSMIDLLLDGYLPIHPTLPRSPSVTSLHSRDGQADSSGRRALERAGESSIFTKGRRREGKTIAAAAEALNPGNTNARGPAGRPICWLAGWLAGNCMVRRPADDLASDRGRIFDLGLAAAAAAERQNVCEFNGPKERNRLKWKVDLGYSVDRRGKSEGGWTTK